VPRDVLIFVSNGCSQEIAQPQIVEGARGMLTAHRFSDAAPNWLWGGGAGSKSSRLCWFSGCQTTSPLFSNPSAAARTMRAHRASPCAVLRRRARASSSRRSAADSVIATAGLPIDHALRIKWP
jgi:hypothetical protein